MAGRSRGGRGPKQGQGPARQGATSPSRSFGSRSPEFSFASEPVPASSRSFGSRSPELSFALDPVIDDVLREGAEAVGTIKSLDAERGFGFIACPQTFCKYGSDVFLHKNHFGNFVLGDMVCFQVTENAKGQPQASELRLYVQQASDEDFSFRGVVKYFDLARGFGFIDCPEASDLYGCDVFVHQTELGIFSKGDVIEFQVKLNKKGQPQAFDLQPAVSDWGDGPSAEAVKLQEQPHHGVVKKVDDVKGFGFVFCQAIMDTYRSDVFVTPQLMKGLLVGDPVSFQIKLDSQGRPQATELSRRAAPAVGDLGGDDLDGDEDEENFRMTGVIKSFNTEKGYGFIASPEAQERYGCDVFLHQKQIKDLQLGDSVTFLARTINGKPQAYKLQEAPKTGTADTEVDSKQEYEGYIKSFNNATGYGFIHCPELRSKFGGRDVFLHSNLFEGNNVGDKVSFRVQVKKGQPQVSHLISLEEDSDAPAPSPEEVAEQVKADSKKLLRACQSAKPESVALVADLLAARADANVRDVTGQTPLMIASLNVKFAERKSKLLIDYRADLAIQSGTHADMVSWARERINARFALFLEATQRGETIDCEHALDMAQEDEF